MSSMTSRPHGLYREQATAESSASAYISYGRHGFSISADRYVHEGHTPAFNSLPWKADYDLARETADES